MLILSAFLHLYLPREAVLMFLSEWVGIVWMLACMILLWHICIIPLWLFYGWTSTLMKAFFKKVIFFFTGDHLSSREASFIFSTPSNVDETYSSAKNWSWTRGNRCTLKLEWVSLHCWWVELEPSKIKQKEKPQNNNKNKNWEIW